MTEPGPHPTLWIPAYAGMTVWWDSLAFTLAFDSSPIKGEGIVGWYCLVVTPPCGYCLKVSMTVKDAGNDGHTALPLWIADQVRNDGVVVPGRIDSSLYSE